LVQWTVGTVSGGVDGWAVGKKDHGCSQTAVLPQTAQFGVNRLGLCAHGVAFTGLEITTAVDADQVMAQGSNDAETIRPFLSIGGASQNSIGYRNAIVLDQQFHYQPTPPRAVLSLTALLVMVRTARLSIPAE